MPLDLNLALFTSTARHFGYCTLSTTIKHYARALGGNLDLFAARFCHVKVRPSETDRLPDIIDTLLDHDIKPIVTTGDWQRGMSHQVEYLKDQAKVFGTQELHNAQYTLFTEDDECGHIHQGTLTRYLEAAIDTLSANKDVLHVRFKRDGVSDLTQPLNDLLHSTNVWDFQPYVARTRDLYLASKVIQDNAAQFATTQCEAAFRMAADTLSNHPYRYLCFNPALASSHHIGAQSYLEIMKTAEFATL